LIFPIVGLAGKVLGFGGRALGEEEPKYLNSPETRVFRKGQNLYGLREARDAIRGDRRAVVVEGYMDVISLHQAGVGNMVAPLGTAFVSEQARLIARFAPRAVLAFDGDDAGRRAAWQAAEHLWEAGVRVKVAILPSGEDPDSFVLARGREGWEEMLEGAPDFVEFALEEGQTGEERETALKRLVSALARVRDELRRGVYLKFVADRAGLPEETLLRSVAAELKRVRRFADTAGEKGSREGTEGSARQKRMPVTERVEWGILRLLIRHPELQEEAARELSPDLFRVGGCREVASRLLGACREGRTFSVEELERCAQAAEAPEVVSAVAAVVVDSEEDEWSGYEEREAERERRRALADYLNRLHGQGTHQALNEVQERLREAQARGDVKASLDLLRRAQQLKQQTITRPDVVMRGGDV
jgi:DNA primase